METTFTSKIDLLPKLKMYHITIPLEILQQTFTDADTGSIYHQRFEITINDQVSWKGGTLALGNDAAYITFSNPRMKKLHVREGDTVNVLLVRDFSKYGFDVPEEFEELLRQDDIARERFESLSMGKRRSIIYLILQVKSSQKRIEKSIFLLENLKRAPVGKETMRHVLGKQ